MRVGRRMIRVVKWENEEEGRLGENGGRRRMVDEGRVMRVVKWEDEERGRGREPGHAGTQKHQKCEQNETHDKKRRLADHREGGLWAWT